MAKQGRKLVRSKFDLQCSVRNCSKEPKFVSIIFLLQNKKKSLKYIPQPYILSCFSGQKYFHKVLGWNSNVG